MKLLKKILQVIAALFRASANQTKRDGPGGNPPPPGNPKPPGG